MKTEIHREKTAIRLQRQKQESSNKPKDAEDCWRTPDSRRGKEGFYPTRKGAWLDSGLLASKNVR